MKNSIRKQKKLERACMTENDVLEKSHQASRIFLNSDIYTNAKNIMLYMPLGNEISPIGIIKAALFENKTVLLPVTDKNTLEISAHKINEDTVFQKGVFSLTEPKDAEPFYPEKIDTILVPGVAFTKKGARVGFGKGCYDMFLSKTQAIKVGFCYEFQLCEEFETNTFDIGMDYILTENELIKVETLEKKV